MNVSTNPMKHGQWLPVLLLLVAGAAPAPARETLYNGIALPDEWPPRSERVTREPGRVPYLAEPPAVIPIDVGRQLFVDDFLIATTNLHRTFHQPEYHRANPVLTPGKPLYALRNERRRRSLGEARPRRPPGNEHRVEAQELQLDRRVARPPRDESRGALQVLRQ